MTADPIAIEGPTLGSASRCEEILRALPDWFGIEEAIVRYVADIDRMPTFLAAAGDRTIGFLTVNRHFPATAEVHVTAVRAEAHRRGIGGALLLRAESWLRAEGVEYLQVKTLGPSRPDGPYDRTRRFYEAMGFRALEETTKLWGERLPCLIMVKGLGGTGLGGTVRG